MVYPKTVRVQVSATDTTASTVRRTHHPDEETKPGDYLNLFFERSDIYIGTSTTEVGGIQAAAGEPQDP